MEIKNLALKLMIHHKKKNYPNEQYHQYGCCLISYQTPLLPYCFILCQEIDKPQMNEKDLIQFAQYEAHRLSQIITNEPNNFIMVISGKNIRKRANWHIHIFIAQNRWQKAYAYQLLAIKNFSLAIYERLANKK